MTGRGAIQVQYRVPRAMMPVSKADLESAFDSWLNWRSTPIGVKVTVWGERLSENDKRRRVRQLGELRHRPGRVDRYAEAHVTMCDHDGPLRSSGACGGWRVSSAFGRIGSRTGARATVGIE
jgi:hypothetical protein